MAIKLTKEKFVEKANKVHNDKYNYNKVEYINSETKVCIICPIHGEFWQTPNVHLNGSGCKKCATKRRADILSKTQEEFLKDLKKIHGDKYDTSKVNYINDNTPITLICHEKDENGIEHGEFNIKPCVLLRGAKSGCSKCGFIRSQAHNKKINQKFKENFSKDLKKIHGDKYDTSKVNYINSVKKVCIICHEKDENGIEHGEFWQEPIKLLKGHGCPKCKSLKLRKKFSDNMETFIKKAKKIHNDEYVYFSDETYINNRTPIKIKCKKHGIFYQKPNAHLNGHGCPMCRESKLEKEMYNFLQENEIDFIYQYRPQWLKNGKGQQSLDFYIPKYHIAIECQGEQHFTPTTFGSKDKTPEKCLDEIKERDRRKLKICNEHNIKILYYSNKIRKDYIGKIYINKNKLLNNIKI